MDKRYKITIYDVIGISAIFGLYLIGLISMGSTLESQEPLESPLYLKQMTCSQLEDSLETASSETEQNIYISNLMILKGCGL